MNLRVLLVSLSTIVLVGCAAPKHNYAPETINISEPPIGSIAEKQVGEEMLQQGRYREHDALQVHAPLKRGWTYTIIPGYFLKTGSDKEGDFYRIGGAGEEAGRVEKTPSSENLIALMVKNDNTLCLISASNVAVCGGPVASFEKVKRPVTVADSVQRTLIYNGRVGEKINIGYREFSGNSARPAFNNNVEYDLSESKEIAYRGAKLEILDATNRSIKYRVISNFNQTAR